MYLETEFNVRFDNQLSLWKARNTKHPNFYATSDAPLWTMLLGQHLWTIHNDSTFCSIGQTYTR